MSRNNPTVQSALSSTSGAPPWTPNVHEHPLDPEAGSTVWAIERFRGHLFSTRFHIYSQHKAFKNISQICEHNARIRRWVKFISAFTYTLQYRKGTATGNINFLSRLLQPATDADRTGRNHLTGPDIVGIYLIRPCGFASNEPSTPGIGLGGLLSPPFRPIPITSNLLPSPMTTSAISSYWDHTWSTPARLTSSSGLFRLTTPLLGRCRPREYCREHRRSSWLDFQAICRLPIVHHWCHGTTPCGSDLSSNPSSSRRCRVNPSNHRRQWLRTRTAISRSQKTYTCPSPAHAPAQAQPRHDNASSHRPHTSRVIRANLAKTGPSVRVFSTDPITTDTSAPGARRRTR